MNLLKNLKNNLSLKINCILLTCLLLVKQLLILFNIFIDYLWIINFLSWRLFYFMYSNTTAKFAKFIIYKGSSTRNVNF